MFSAWSSVVVPSPSWVMRIPANVNGVSVLGFIFISLSSRALLVSNSSSPVIMMSSTCVPQRPVQPFAVGSNIAVVFVFIALLGLPIMVLLPKVNFFFPCAAVAVVRVCDTVLLLGRMHRAWSPVVAVILRSDKIAFLILLCQASPDPLSP